MNVPGYFEDENEKIDAIEFINTFIELIAKPISPNEEYLEYLPTQIFVEYLRHKSINDKNIKGIVYKSSKAKSKNIALFYTNTECKDMDNVVVDEDCLVLESIKTEKM